MSRRCCHGPRLADPPAPHQGAPDMDSLQPSSIYPAKLNALLQRAVEDLSAGYGGVMMSLGHPLGLYKAMAGAGPLRPTARSGSEENRYDLQTLMSRWYAVCCSTIQ